MSVKVISTVVAAGGYDLTSLDAVKGELSISDGSKDDVLKRYITSASAAVSQYCNRKFQAETIKDEFWPDRDLSPVIAGVDVVQLTRGPVVSVASVTDNGVPLTETSGFRVDYDNAQVFRLDDLAYPRRWCGWPIAVQYVGGFETIPPDVEDAVIRMVTRRYSAKGRDPNLKQQNIPGVLEQSWWIATGAESGNMTPDIADILDNYRFAVVV